MLTHDSILFESGSLSAAAVAKIGTHSVSGARHKRHPPLRTILFNASSVILKSSQKFHFTKSQFISKTMLVSSSKCRFRPWSLSKNCSENLYSGPFTAINFRCSHIHRLYWGETDTKISVHRSVFCLFSCFLVNDISSLLLMWSDIHFINIHYELTTGTFPPNTVWFGEETDVMVLLVTWKHSIHLYLTEGSNETDLCIVIEFSYTILSFIVRTHILFGSDVLTFVCLLPLSACWYIRNDWSGNFEMRTTSRWMGWVKDI